MSKLPTLDYFDFKKSYLGLATLCFAIGIISYTFQFLDFLSALTPILVVILFVVTLMPGATRLYRSIDFFEPIYAVLGMYLLFFGVRTIVILINPTMLNSIIYSYPVSDILPNLDMALFYTIVGLGFFIIGYYSKLPLIVSKIIPLLPNWNTTSMVRILFFYIISWLFRFINMRIGFYGSSFHAAKSPDVVAPITYDSLILLASTLPLYGYACYTLWFFASCKKKGVRISIIIWLVMFVLELINSTFLGWKGGFIPIILIPAIAYHYAKKKICAKHVALMVFVVIIFLYTSFPIVIVYRDMARSSFWAGRFFEDFSMNVYSTFKQVSSYSIGTYLKEITQSILNRIAGIDSMVILVKCVPAVVDFQYGRTLINLFISFVPRALWPAKPTITTGWLFATKFLGWNQTFRSQAGITQLGDLYLNFHIIGIIVGMFATGVLVRSTYLYLIKRNKVGMLSILLYIFSFYSFLKIEKGIAESYVYLLEQIAIVFLVIWLIKSPRK